MRAFILLTIVALAVASPIDDKKTPDISSLPLKKDDSKNSTGRVIDSYTQDGIHATPLHKRDTQQVASPSLNPAPTGAPKYGQQPSSLNNQHPLTGVNSNTKVASSPSAVNQPKTSLYQTDPIPPRPLSHSNVQPNLASSSRVRRDAPKPVDTKTAPQPSSTSGQKSSQVPAQKSPQVTSQLKTPSAVPAKAPAQGSRVTRDAPKPVDTKTAPQPSSLSGQKSSVPARTPAVDAKKSPAPVADKSPAVTSTNSRKTREAPKPVDTKTAPQPSSTSGQKSSVPAATANKPIASSVRAPAVDAKKSPAPVADKSPAVASTNSRRTREAPNPHEQSKIVPSSSSTGVHLNKDATPLNPVVSAKSPATSTPLHKRESPASNVRGDSQPLSSSSSNNQSPQFVHPVPVDHILKTKPASTSSSVTKTDNVQITPSLPTTETKTVEAAKVAVDAKH